MKSDGKGEKFAINDIICNFVSNDYQKSVCNTFIYKIIDPLWNLGNCPYDSSIPARLNTKCRMDW